MASSDTKLAIAQVATTVQSIGQARAALGVVTQVLQEGYAKLDELSSLGGTQDAARSLLDQNNAYASKIYAVWTDEADLQDEEISVYNATRVAACMEQARSNVRLIEDIAAEDIWNLANLFEQAIKEAVAIAADAGAALAKVLKVPLVFGAALLEGLWPVVLIVAFGIGVYFWARGRAIKALLP